MIRFWLNVTSLMIILSLLLTGALMGMGTLAPKHPVVGSFQQCDGIPCWLGIDVRNMTITQAREIVVAHGYTGFDDNYVSTTGLCDTYLNQTPQNSISSVYITRCGSLTLGDIWEVLGAPTLVAEGCENTWMLSYSNGSITVTVYAPLTLRSTVTQVYMYDAQAYGLTPLGYRWRGFAPMWRYQQFETHPLFC